MAPYVAFVFVSIFTLCHGRIAPPDYAGYSPTSEAAATPSTTNSVEEYKPQAIAESQFSTRDYRASYQPLVYTEAPTQTVQESQGSIATTPFSMQDYRASHQIGPTQTTFDVPNVDSSQGSIATTPFSMQDYRASHQIGPTQTSVDVPNAASSPFGTPSTYNDAPVTIVGNNVCDACGCCEHCGSSGCTHNCPTCTSPTTADVQSVRSTSCACRRLSKRMLLMNVKCCKGCNCGFDYGIPNGDYHSNDYGGNGNVDYDTTPPFDMQDYRASHQIAPNAASTTYNDVPVTVVGNNVCDACGCCEHCGSSGCTHNCPPCTPPAIEDSQSVPFEQTPSTMCACRRLSKRMLLLNVKCCKGCNCGGDYDTTVLPDATTVQPETSSTTTTQPDPIVTTIPETSYVELVSSKTANYCNPYTCGLQESPFYGGVGSCGVGYECPESVRKCTKCNPAKCKCKKGYKIKYTKKCGAQGVSCSCKNAKCVPITKTAFLRAAEFSTTELDYDSSDYYYLDSLPNPDPAPLFVPDPVPQPEHVAIVVNPDPVQQPEHSVVNPDPVPQPEPVAVVVPESVHTPVHDHAVMEVPIPFVVMPEPSTHSVLASTLTIHQSSPPLLSQPPPPVRLNQTPPPLAKIKVAPPTVPPPSRTTNSPPSMLKKIDSTPPFKPLTRDSSKPSGSLHYEIHVHSTTTVGKTLPAALVAINAFTFIGLAFL